MIIQQLAYAVTKYNFLKAALKVEHDSILKGMSLSCNKSQGSVLAE